MPMLKEVAMEVLSRASGPLSIEEITQRAQELGILTSTSKTPAASVGAAIYMDIKRNSASPFVQTRPRQFVLRSGLSVKRGEMRHGHDVNLEEKIADHNRQVKERLLKALKEMHPRALEHLIGSCPVKWCTLGSTT